MAAVVLFNTNPVAANATVVSSATALTAPYRGLVVTIAQAMAGTPGPYGCEVDYAVSIDGGTTYSDWVFIGACNPAVTNDVCRHDILINDLADHIKVQIRNRDGVNQATTLVVTAETFA